VGDWVGWQIEYCHSRKQGILRKRDASRLPTIPEVSRGKLGGIGFILHSRFSIRDFYHPRRIDPYTCPITGWTR
jgi:hypothetical protein